MTHRQNVVCGHKTCVLRCFWGMIEEEKKGAKTKEEKHCNLRELRRLVASRNVAFCPLLERWSAARVPSVDRRQGSWPRANMSFWTVYANARGTAAVVSLDPRIRELFLPRRMLTLIGVHRNICTPIPLRNSLSHSNQVEHFPMSYIYRCTTIFCC